MTLDISFIYFFKVLLYNKWDRAIEWDKNQKNKSSQPIKLCHVAKRGHNFFSTIEIHVDMLQLLNTLIIEHSTVETQI